MQILFLSSVSNSFQPSSGSLKRRQYAFLNPDDIPMIGSSGGSRISRKIMGGRQPYFQNLCFLTSPFSQFTQKFNIFVKLTE